MTYDHWKTTDPADMDESYLDPEEGEEEPPYCDHCLADFATKRLGCEKLCDACFEGMVEAQKADYAHDISDEDLENIR
jgi:hypothetical protein